MADLRERLARSRLAPPDASGWERGVPGFWLSTLLADWQAFDVSRFQARLDKLTHLRASLDGQVVHLLHLPGRGPDPMPLLLTHGWPGSFCEYLDLLPLLTSPEAHGGDPGDAFTVVVPSLPGFGFSAPPPPGGLTHGAVAALWHRLMADGLGYRRYAAHGGDLGAGVTAWLARAHADAVAGIHLATPGLPAPPAPWTPAEQAYFAEAESWAAEEGGYAPPAGHQALDPGCPACTIRRPASPPGSARRSSPGAAPPATGRLLSPGTCSWAPSPCTGPPGPSPPRCSPTGPTATPPAAPLQGQPSEVPTAVSVFGGEQVPFPKPPRELAERYFTITTWHEHDRGGHFPAVAEPQLLAQTLRDVLRPVRGSR